MFVTVPESQFRARLHLQRDANVLAGVHRFRGATAGHHQRQVAVVIVVGDGIMMVIRTGNAVPAERIRLTTTPNRTRNEDEIALVMVR